MMPMMTTAIFSGIKNRGRTKDFKIWGGGGGVDGEEIRVFGQNIYQ